MAAATDRPGRIGDDLPVEHVLQRIPPFPAALGTVLRCCASEDPSAAEIAQAVSMEEVLAARVVRAANSAAMAPLHAVDNVTTAVARLGGSAIRSMAAAYFLTNTFSSAFSHAGLDRESLWRHNLATAAASGGAAGSGAERANAYFAGLMHDVGIMMFAAELGPIYSDCFSRIASTGESLTSVETEVLGLDHTEMGAEGAQQWNFAPEIVDAVRQHHNVLATGTLSQLASHVVVGNQVANEMGYSLHTRFSGLGGQQDTIGAPASGLGEGLMSRARWALTREQGRIEAMLSSVRD